MEPGRFSFHRLAPVALAALGIFGALLTIFAGLAALNHTVLPFKGWPLDGERLNTGTQVLPRAPVESGRLRTAPGGALAGASPLVHAGVLPTLAVTTPVHTTLGVGLRVQRGRSHAVLPKRSTAPAPQPVVVTPPPAAPTPAEAAPTPAPAPVATPAPTAAVVSAAPAARHPATSTSTVTASSPGNGHGNGRAHAPGQLKKIAAAAAPAAAPPPAPVAPDTDDHGDGNGNGHGPPPWAHGNH